MQQQNDFGTSKHSARETTTDDDVIYLDSLSKKLTIFAVMLFLLCVNGLMFVF